MVVRLLLLIPFQRPSRPWCRDPITCTSCLWLGHIASSCHVKSHTTPHKLLHHLQSLMMLPHLVCICGTFSSRRRSCFPLDYAIVFTSMMTFRLWLLCLRFLSGYFSPRASPCPLCMHVLLAASGNKVIAEIVDPVIHIIPSSKSFVGSPLRLCRWFFQRK